MTAITSMSSALIGSAAMQALKKLDPRRQIRTPVMFVVYVGGVGTALLFIEACRRPTEDPPWFILAISVCLWLTVIFANFAEAVAECRGRAQADSLRRTRRGTLAKRLAAGSSTREYTEVAATALRAGDLVLVQPGDIIPADGEIVEGVATVDESAITGESAPVIRECGGDRSSVTGGTRLLSDWLIVRVTSEPGKAFLDRMIAMVEGARRAKTPNELALDILIAALTIVFLLAVTSLFPFLLFSQKAASADLHISLTTLIALLVCLIPTTIGGLLSAIRVAGIDRLVRVNVLATSGRAVEAAGDIDILLLDKTGTITFGNRQASAFLPAPGVDTEELAETARIASLSDETPEGRSIVALASRITTQTGSSQDSRAQFVPFSAQTRMSGVDLRASDGTIRMLRKGAPSAIRALVERIGGAYPPSVDRDVQSVAKRGSTPLLCTDGTRVLGTIELKDVVKGGIKERFAELRSMGIKTVMVTGDNPITAASIAAEAGVDAFLAEATPERKLELIREHQAAGRLVAMTGDGTNDAPALAQADVAVAMNSGTQAAKEAGNMIDLDSDPTKLIEIIGVGKQLLMTRGSLTTFSIANDVAKYFAILPAAFASTYPEMGALNVMHLHSPESAVLSAVIFNAFIIVALVPLALRGVGYRPARAAEILRRNALLYGIGGLLVPFCGIKLIDLAVGLCL